MATSYKKKYNQLLQDHLEATQALVSMARENTALKCELAARDRQLDELSEKFDKLAMRNMEQLAKACKAPQAPTNPPAKPGK